MLFPFDSEFHELNNSLDLGMKSTRGLKPPKISTKEANRSLEKGTKILCSDATALALPLALIILIIFIVSLYLVMYFNFLLEML